LERRYMDLAYHSGPISVDGDAAKNELAKLLLDLDPRVLEAIERALTIIDDSLSSQGSG
jgi:hypothetical protein